MELFLEPIEISSSDLDWKKTIKVVEDYKPLDIQSATMNLPFFKAFVRVIRTGNISLMETVVMKTLRIIQLKIIRN